MAGQIQKYFLNSYFYFIILLYVHSVAGIRNESRCGSVDIRNTPKMAYGSRHSKTVWSKYKSCTILEGDFTISMITNNNITEDMFPVFENLREITGSVLVFQIRGLTSLGKMFPNLRVIGGHSLIMNYALVVYQNNDLRDVGLTKLTAIKNGGVRITENPRLCYTRTVNWETILSGKVRDIIIDQVAGQCKNDCPTSNGGLCQQLTKMAIACWNSTHCQRTCLEEAYSMSGCTESGETCHEECLGGCFKSDDNGSCYSCRNLDWEGICVSKCPPFLYEQLGRRCLTKHECEELPRVTISLNEHAEWKAFQGQCHYECPAGYKEDPTNHHNCIECPGYCPKKCPGDLLIDSIGTAMKFSKCNLIEGNLEIDLRIGIETAPAEKFTEAFGEIEEITGYLMIRFSPAFMSLSMFKKLSLIRGESLYKNSYALAVFENQNLHSLFEIGQQKMVIERGGVSFQNNRMLCNNKIEELINHLGLRNRNDTVIDVSPYSNGDKAICDEEPLEIKVISVFATGFVISWTPFNTTDLDHRKFLGYQIFYKKVDVADPNMSIMADRSACYDSWNMLFITDENDSLDEPHHNLHNTLSTEKHDGSNAIIYNEDVPSSDHDDFNNFVDEPNRLRSQRSANNETTTLARNPADQPAQKGGVVTQGVEPNTLYAVYVQTRLVNHPGARNAISKIHFIKTIFGIPDPPRITESYSINSTALKLVWDPPLFPAGDITHYMVLWNLAGEYNNAFKLKDVCEKRSTFHQLIKSQSYDLKSQSSAQATCPKQLGCCRCEETSPLSTDRLQLSNAYLSNNGDSDTRKESSNFEDALQNTIFVQKANKANQFTRLKRSLRSFTPPSYNGTFGAYNHDLHIEPYIDIEQINVLHPRTDLLNKSFNVTSEYGKINITGTSIILTGLPHFSEYHITIYACQDVRAVEHFCSGRAAWTAIKTDPIPLNDRVNPNTVIVFPTNETNEKEDERRIYWSPPAKPNGVILAYRAKLLRGDSTPVEQCIPFELFENETGILFTGLADGTYTLEIRVETSAMFSNKDMVTTIIPDIFTISTLRLFSTKSIVIMSAFLIFVVLPIALIAYCILKRTLNKKIREYWKQTISANPEYLSQLELYRADEWELKRDEINLESEIGRGTFGKVFRGYGKNVQTVNGEIFGPCAVKTVTEETSSSERLHFLLEASVMKQFSTPFIVKLYGVVSDGQPVLVVMELMEKGNLRDFLRSHRPGAPENTEKRPLPTAEQYFTWAAQIADGMAYLESLKFCHRDLAARNCMVHGDESVKIGDFGMARDIYYHEYYRPTGKRLMPVRWMAPEALKDGKFTMKSDVWSYGIVLYEMLTLGQQPYAGLGNDKVFQYTGVHRHVLNRPEGCPDFWYGLMLLCWKYDPRERPNFSQLVRYLEKYSSADFKNRSFIMNELEHVEEDFDFSINPSDEVQNRNEYDEEFQYGMDSEEEEENDEENMGDFVTEENLDEMKRPVCANNRRVFADVESGAQNGAPTLNDLRKQEILELNPHAH